MAKNEATTDLWVWSMLKDAGIELEYQGSSIVEIKEALKTASKSGTGKSGFPEFVGVVKDFLIVIENKLELSKHIKLDDRELISMEKNDVKNFAINGALYYGKHLTQNTTYKKVIAFGISGTEKKHRISPLFIDETEYYRTLPDVESFISFNEKNIEEYYVREVLKEETDKEKETADILKEAAALHEDLRNYGNLKDIDKPLIVSGILLALRESEKGSFSIDSLTGDSIETDGKKIYNAISSNLVRSKIAPDVKKDKILSQFTIIRDTQILNEINPKLNKTPLKHFTEFLNEKLYRSIKYTKSSEDYLGRFYGEFMSYSGGDGQTLGIVLTPKHIVDLFCELAELKDTDVVLDPCCGTGGFLVAAMHHMLEQVDKADINRIKSIKQKQLHGIELQPYMFTIATTNMILRGDGKSNLINEDFLKQNPNQLQLKQPTVGMMNPPYSQGSKRNPDLYEIAFTEHLLDSLTEGATGIIIVPQSSMTGKTKEEESIKKNILKKHTLEGVITLNKDTFYGVGTMPCIAVFTAGEPHPANKKAKFINFQDDGYKVSPHIGLLETEQAKDKRQHLLDVWFERIDFESKFCVETTIEATDEWLHSFYYFNDELPTEEDFEKTIGDYLTFEFSMLMQNRGYLFEAPYSKEDVWMRMKLTDREWREFELSGKNGIFRNFHGKRLVKKNRIEGKTPLLTAGESNQGVSEFISNQEMERYSDCISIDMFGNAFYHGYTCCGDDNIYFFINDEISKEAKLFIVNSINNNKSKYSYGKQFRQGNADNTKVMLPINEMKEPDFKFMEQYVKEIEKTKRQMYFAYIQKQVE